MPEEGLKKTDDELIHIGKPIPFDIEVFFQQLEALAKACYKGETSDVIAMVSEITGTYRPMERKAAENQETHANHVKESKEKRRFTEKKHFRNATSDLPKQRRTGHLAEKEGAIVDLRPAENTQAAASK